MDNKILQSIHIKVPQNCYQRLKKESNDENKAMKKIIMEALDLYWKKQQPISLKDALKVESSYKFCSFSGTEIQKFAREVIPEELKKRALKLLKKAEEANIIAENKKGYTSWQGPETGSDQQLWERIHDADWSWIDELIEMSRNGFLENYLKHSEEISKIRKIKNKLLPQLKEKGELNLEEFKEEISKLNNLQKNITNFKMEKYLKQLKNEYPSIKSNLENEMLMLEVTSAINNYKKLYPKKTKKEIIDELLK